MMEKAFEAGSPMVGGGDVELMEKVKHKGRAYQCLACHYKEGRVVIDVNGRVEDHILKNHVRLDEVPFYCSLCLFRCHTLDQLNRHVTAYARHVEMAKKRSIRDHQPYLMRSSNPYRIGGLDYMQLTAEESRRHFMQQAKLRRGREERHPITQVMQQIYNSEFPAEFEDLIRMVEASPMAERGAGSTGVIQTPSPFLVAENMVPRDVPVSQVPIQSASQLVKTNNAFLRQPLKVPGRMSAEQLFQPVSAVQDQMQDTSQLCISRPAQNSQVVSSIQPALGQRSVRQTGQAAVPVYSKPVILSQTPVVYSTIGTPETVQLQQPCQIPTMPVTQSTGAVNTNCQDLNERRNTYLSPNVQRTSTCQGACQTPAARAISSPSLDQQPPMGPVVQDSTPGTTPADRRIIQCTLETAATSTQHQPVTVRVTPAGCQSLHVPTATLRVSSSIPLHSITSRAELNEISFDSPSSPAEPEGAVEGEVEDPLSTNKDETVAPGQTPRLKEDRREEKPDNDHEENIMPQLLPEEMMDLATPKKRQQAENHAVEPVTKRSRTSTDGPSFNVSQVALNGLVEAIQGLKEEVSRSVKTSERVEKALKENATIMSKVTDAMTRLKNAIESNDKEERRREDRKMEAERRREEERRREREEDRKREDRRRELERKEREERRLEQDRKEREQRKQGDDKRQKADGKRVGRKRTSRESNPC